MSEIVNDGRKLANATIQSLLKATEHDLELSFNLVQVAACHMLANLCINVPATGGDSLEETKKKILGRFEKELEFITKMKAEGGGYHVDYPPKKPGVVN